MLFDKDFQVPLSVFAHGSESGNSTCGATRRGAFRQARPLAEGQKSLDVKHDFTIPPPSANQDSWRRGSNFPRKMQLLVSWSRHLAVGVLRSEAPPRLVAIL